MTRYFILIIAFCFVAMPKLFAQTAGDSLVKQTVIDSVVRAQLSVAPIPPDSTATRINDTTGIRAGKKLPFEPKPKKAGLYSAIIPGMGQIYNRQYWKAPVIYAGMAAAGFFFVDNRTKYQTFRKAYIGRIDGDINTSDAGTSTEKYTTDNLKQGQDSYRRFLDLTVLFSALGYTVQVIDAIAAAHLKNFDISRDITMRMQPVVNNNYIGYGLVMNFK